MGAASSLPEGQRGYVMKKMRRFTALGLTAAMAVTALAGCGGSNTASTTAAATEAAKTEAATEAAAPAEQTASGGKVYYLNFKPEQADQWVDLAKKYTEETGVEVHVQTAASGTYEQTLKSEMAKSEAPTLFQVNGPVGLATWDDYCMDLKDTDVFKDLESEDYALKNTDGVVKGIAYVIETYGIIYNKKIRHRTYRFHPP